MKRERVRKVWGRGGKEKQNKGDGAGDDGGKKMVGKRETEGNRGVQLHNFFTEHLRLQGRTKRKGGRLRKEERNVGKGVKEASNPSKMTRKKERKQ